MHTPPTGSYAARSICIQTIQVLKDGQDPRDVNWQTDGELGFEAFEGSHAWYGRLPLAKYRKDWPRDGIQGDLSGFDELIRLLRPIPKDEIYPRFPIQEITQYNPEQGDHDKALYFKAPKLGHHRDGSDELATRLLNEAKIHEKILRNPHPNLGSYIGCVEEEGRLVRLVFKRHITSVYDLIEAGVQEEFTSQQRRDCMDQVEAAVAHLHSMGLAHNDISPSNIMIDDAGQGVLIDFDSCAPLGSPITKGGLVTGWKGPIAGEGPQFNKSSVECDKMAIQEIRAYLTI